MPQDTEHKTHSQTDSVDDKHAIDDASNHEYNADVIPQDKSDFDYRDKEDRDKSDSDAGALDDTDVLEDTEATEHLEDEDFSEKISKEDKETIKKVAHDDNLSQAKSHASILVEQAMDAKKTFGRSLGSLFTSALTAGLEIGISFFMILSAFALLSGVLPNHYALVIASLLYPIGFIIVVIGQSLLFTEQTSLLSLPVLNGIEPLNKLLRLWGIVIAGNVVGGCLFAALMIGLGLNMQLFSASDIDAYAEHILGFRWWVIFGSAILAGWMMGVTAWLVTSARDTLSRIVLVTVITGSIGFLGLHHSIIGNIEIFSALLYGNTVSLWRYLLFLAVILVGNTIGGVVFVAVLKNRTFLFDVEKVKEQTANDRADARTHVHGRRP
ncbi:formate/nitrite transporter family protein [Psychrobacter sp. UBA3068]|uniref:formate/nitrite transporter family protein n=1 Tax=Psychrobacter sp. UBA3068 TaxID=1947349 RepID=UPI00257ED0D9|nr:formate/nitrite transporter family protein [Psychrobacter sp. UBA3068]